MGFEAVLRVDRSNYISCLTSVQTHADQDSSIVEYVVTPKLEGAHTTVAVSQLPEKVYVYNHIVLRSGLDRLPSYRGEQW